MSRGELPPLLAEVIAADAALLDTFGITVVAADEQRVVLEAIPPAALVNSLGVAHGALLFSVADTAAAYALASRGARGATIGSSMTYARPAKSGVPVVAAARVVTQGRTLATVRATITSEGKTVGHGMFQFMLLGEGT
ncbi:MAG TPA: hotdog domain-containing protein [Acidimicrobiia bacterium]|jgi:acyl-CoA thioesterase|nr:hotdog domain-containing protein [Acidimicrobiia bacterium]